MDKCQKRRNSKRLHRAVRNVLNEYGLNENKVENIVKKEVEHYFKKHVHGLLNSDIFNSRFEKLITDVLNQEFRTQYPKSLTFMLHQLVKQWISEKLENVVDIVIKPKENN